MTTSATPPVVWESLSAKDQVRALLHNLPDDVTLQDIQYHIDVVAKVLEAEASLQSGGGVPHEEVKRRIFDKWREDSRGTKERSVTSVK